MRRKKFAKNLNENEIIKLNCYAVNSIICNLYYLIDYKNFAMVRGTDGVIWDISDTPKEANKFISEIKDEILAIYEDICDLKVKERLYHQAQADRKTEWKRNGIY